MSELVVKVDNMLRFDDTALPYEAQVAVGRELWSYNPDDPDEQIMLARRTEDGLIAIPRGYALRLRTLLPYYGVDVVWDDRRAWVPAAVPMPTSWVRPVAYQMRAVQRMVAAQQGIYEGPTASGKTVTAAIVTSSIRQRTLIVVDKINLATQWAERFKQALGVEPEIIGDGYWSEGDITIALRQSLWAKHEELTASGWWATWGAVFVDECHAVSAETVRETLQMFPAYFRFGLSATPDRRVWLMAASRAIIGEIVCRTTEQELRDAGLLVKPRVIAVRTPFRFKVARDEDSRSQWTRLVQEMKEDVGRNHVIGQILASQRGHTVMVQADHTSYCQYIYAYACAYGWPEDRVHFFIGATRGSERDEIRRLCEEGDRLVITTIGKEAMDIPRLDRYVMAWPSKSETDVKQMIGRVKRAHETKVEPPIVFDLYDNNVSRLKNMFTRRRGVYEREGLDLSFVDAALPTSV